MRIRWCVSGTGQGFLGRFLAMLFESFSHKTLSVGSNVTPWQA
ncbi:hypothetical protein BRCON_2748 [Candidatus Sumerlaea chitinivorans]|uniref:Uncharacterized protein n=1 Tax=Sumerlaea chitinivorans TaxID=2250252 RepID=A0A2Z4Y8C8_SUMC1|nr:hypothetical protein BRCON_2748 [Candidatus Sumerlaea chitinivorans]